MLNNIDLFNECLENKVKNIDPYNREILNKVIIPDKKDVFCELLNINYKLIDLITKFNHYNVIGDNSNTKEIINEIDKCLKYEGMNFCPFSQYLMIHDVNYDMYLNVLDMKEKEFIIKCYIEDRHQMYLNIDYSDIIFQVLSDNYSHKRKGRLGVKKLEKICQDFGMEKIMSEEQLKNDKYYILPDSDGKKLFKLILEIYNIHFDFEKSHQGKNPDLLIKWNDIFVIVEHKNSKELGGGQDKQMTEIIDFIGYDERGIHYVSYLDGVLFNDLKDPRDTNKIYRDKMHILNNLEHNKYNYFVNNYGFKKLISSIIEMN